MDNMKKIKRFSEKLVYKSLEDLSEEIGEYDYILGDEGYRVDMTPPYFSKMDLHISPKLEKEIDKLKSQTLAIQDLYMSDNDLCLKKFPWMKGKIVSRKTKKVIISWKELLHHHLNDQDFFQEWLDRISEICESNYYTLELSWRYSIAEVDHTGVGVRIKAGAAYRIERKQ